ncbi:3-keto-5-aminohexanoate cleavage protein [Wenyingzhuangia sp. IMCC45533]
MNRDVVINFCPTGMVPTTKMTPHVPVSASKIIEEVHQANELGITVVHLHVRDKDEIPCYKKNAYREVFEGIRKHCSDLVICGSSSGRNFPEFEKRSEVLELKPDMCSLTLSSLNFLKQASLNSPDIIIALAEKMNDYGVVPELECFDLGMINYGKYLIKKGILKGPFYWNLIFGNIAGFQPTLRQIGTVVSEIPDDHYLGLGGLADCQLTINATAVAYGYGVRVGVEDNIWWDMNRTKKCTNLELIKRIHLLMKIHQKKLLTSKKFGELGFYNKNNF